MSDLDNANLPQFYPPVRDLKLKVGKGGLSENLLLKAQKVIDTNTVDFIDIANPYLLVLGEGIATASSNQEEDHEALIDNILFPAMQLKANGEIFHYPIITKIAAKLLWFLERIYKLNPHALEIVNAFDGAIQLSFKKKLKGPITDAGQAVLDELDLVCTRYFEKYPDNVHPRTQKKD